MKFDKLDVGGQKVPMVTNLNAIADNAPALWAFSGDAQGNYGIDNLLSAHAGSTDPVGTTIVLGSQPKFETGKGRRAAFLLD